MKKSINQKAPPIVKNKTDTKEIKSEQEQNSADENFSYSTESLMPELEELVKKNPNKLIGCGG